jgi:IS5 family transposase
VGGTDRGFEANKKTFGRKRHILVDAAGLVLLVHVQAATLHDTVGSQLGAAVGAARSAGL